MKITQVHIVGFRNFKDAKINLEEKTLFIGANDVGKSNLIHALRMILDRTLSDSDIEPNDSDFFAYEETNEFKITIYFNEVVEEKVLAKLKGLISDNGELCIQYHAQRAPVTLIKTYSIKIGPSDSQLQEIEERIYRCVLDFQYIESRRDLFEYIKREKKYLLQEAKSERSDSEIAEDEQILTEIEDDLTKANKSLTNLTFIKKSTSLINTELKDLSNINDTQEICFDTGIADKSKLIDNLRLSSKANGNQMLIGGDGKNNQIYLALWAAKNQVREEDDLRVNFYCIEEPEAHLHPHQQRRIAEYLNEKINSQLFISTHSPQITAEFSPNSIVRLYSENYCSKAASDGVSIIINKALEKFGHRLNIIASEAFFSSLVVLVEGVSDMLVLKALSEHLQEDLDQRNISIIPTEGVGFNVYIEILNALNIPWIVKTDNDVSKVPKKEEYRLAGFERVLELYKNHLSGKSSELDLLNRSALPHFATEDIANVERAKIYKEYNEELKTLGIFISEDDLENDLANSELYEKLNQFYKCNDKEELIKQMQSRKAENMFSFLAVNSESLTTINKDNPSVAPLYYAFKRTL